MELNRKVLLIDFATSVLLMRRLQYYKDGVPYTDVITRKQILANIQPIETTLIDEREGNRFRNAIRIYTKSELKLDDIIKWCDKCYLIKLCEFWSHMGYYKADAIEIDIDEPRYTYNQ